jgi:protein gp37
MGLITTIAWCDGTWNPWQGCRHVSPGCDNCYMYTWMRRWGWDPTVVRRSKTTFRDPLRWHEPQRIFTCSLSDFFIQDADAWRPEAWEIIRQTPRHTYLILTKRPQLIRARLPEDWGTGYPNVWLGVSVENPQMQANRIPIFLQIPAVHRFLSIEPLLEPLAPLDLTGMSWVIVGGESSPGYRPMPHTWVWPILEACQRHDVAFFFKQSAGLTAETGTALQHADGTSWYHQEWPDERRAPIATASAPGLYLAGPDAAR